MTEWIEWGGGPTEITLDDGRCVTVDEGDLLLAELDGDDIEAFLDHDPVNRSIH